MNRQEHIQWCKGRALEYLEQGNIHGACTSMMSDLGKHPETERHPVRYLMVALMANGHLSTPKDVRKHIEGFN